MTTAYIYEETGKIVGVRSGNHSSVVIDAEAYGKSYVISDVDANMDTHYVKVDTKEIVAYPSQPSEGHVFNYGTEEWELDIALARSNKWKEVKLERQIRELSTFDWNSHTFQCDEISQIRLQAAVQAATIDDTISMVWTLADNSTETFNATELKQIGKALADHLKVCHDRGRILRGEINAAQNLEELEAVSW